jgi:type IV secretory pathway VirB10-like protein
MPGRVLNFLEFSDKYSNGSDEPVNVDDIKNASSNFEEGFDEETYDQPQIGANRPISGNYDMTPAGPGEEGAPSFSADNSDDMQAPSDIESNIDNQDMELPKPTNTSDEDEEEEDEDDENEEDEELEEGNPEAGANPKKKVDEGITLVKGFIQFLNEDCEECGEQIDGDDKFNETCPDCKEDYELSEDGTVSCGCNM